MSTNTKIQLTTQELHAIIFALNLDYETLMNMKKEELSNQDSLDIKLLDHLIDKLKKAVGQK
jgi:hypothetical protein